MAPADFSHHRKMRVLQRDALRRQVDHFQNTTEHNTYSCQKRLPRTFSHFEAEELQPRRPAHPEVWDLSGSELIARGLSSRWSTVDVETAMEDPIVTGVEFSPSVPKARRHCPSSIVARARSASFRANHHSRDEEALRRIQEHHDMGATLVRSRAIEATLPRGKTLELKTEPVARCVLSGSTSACFGGGGSWRAPFEEALGKLIASVVGKTACIEGLVNVSIEGSKTRDGLFITARFTLQAGDMEAPEELKRSILSGTLLDAGVEEGAPESLVCWLRREVSLEVFRVVGHHDWTIESFRQKLRGRHGAALLASNSFSFGPCEDCNLHLHTRGFTQFSPWLPDQEVQTAPAELTLSAAATSLPSFPFAVSSVGGQKWTGPYGRKDSQFIPGGPIGSLEDLLERADANDGALSLRIEVLRQEVDLDSRVPQPCRSASVPMPAASLGKGVTLLEKREGFAGLSPSQEVDVKLF